MVYPVPGISAESLYELLADNVNLVKSSRLHKGYEMKALNQAFRTASEYYSVIEEGGYSVFVPRGRGKEIWEEIQKNGKHRDIEYAKLKNRIKEAQHLWLIYRGMK